MHCTSTLSCLRYPAARAARMQYRTTRAEQHVVGFGAFRIEYDDGVAERRWVCMISEAAPSEEILVTW